jgi:hypothetical protein
MMSLDALAGDLSCRLAGVNPKGRPVYLPLTMNFSEGLTIKIYLRFTINVPSSFAFKAESVTRAS